MIEIISATRLSEPDFWKTSALGISLRRLARDRRLTSQVAFQNSRGLPEVFNSRIFGAGEDRILVFVHDDVWLDDFFLADRLVSGLEMFDLLGVAGNRRRVVNQPSWAVIDTRFKWDGEEHLSGSVAHGKHPFGSVAYFGPVPAECELLDGVFLAAKRSTLADSGVLFDPQFAFHFYDMDLCRTARGKQLRLGTWPIALTHQSGGAFGAPAWVEGYRKYLKKWGA